MAVLFGVTAVFSDVVSTLPAVMLLIPFAKGTMASP